MRRLLAALAAWLVAGSAAALTLTDDAGRTVTLAAPAQRVATLAPFLAELAFSAGVGARVVAASEHSDFPDAARALPRVSSAAGIAIESLAATRPDLVLAWQDAITPADVERLRVLRIPVFIAQARSLADVPRLLEAIGALAGVPVGGIAAGYRERIEKLRAAHRGVEPIPVLLEIWHQPLTTLAGRHWINEALAVCGARNAFDDLPGIAPGVPWELVIARAPRVIVGAGSARDAAAFAAQWADRSVLAAVRERRLVFVPGDLLQRPTLRLADGVTRLCDGLDRLRD